MRRARRQRRSTSDDLSDSCQCPVAQWRYRCCRWPPDLRLSLASGGPQSTDSRAAGLMAAPAGGGRGGLPGPPSQPPCSSPRRCSPIERCGWRRLRSHGHVRRRLANVAADLLPPRRRSSARCGPTLVDADCDRIISPIHATPTFCRHTPPLAKTPGVLSRRLPGAADTSVRRLVDKSGSFDWRPHGWTPRNLRPSHLLKNGRHPSCVVTPGSATFRPIEGRRRKPR